MLERVVLFQLIFLCYHVWLQLDLESKQPKSRPGLKWQHPLSGLWQCLSLVRGTNFEPPCAEVRQCQSRSKLFLQQSDILHSSLKDSLGKFWKFFCFLPSCQLLKKHSLFYLGVILICVVLRDISPTSTTRLTFVSRKRLRNVIFHCFSVLREHRMV